MRKQVIFDNLHRQLSIENYSEQTIKNYLSAIKLFLEFVDNSKVEKVTNEVINNYLFYCKLFLFFYEAGYCLYWLSLHQGF